jgi:hypothetical protein
MKHDDDDDENNNNLNAMQDINMHTPIIRRDV